MLKNSTATSPLVYARLAGALYLIVFCFVIFAELFVRQSIIVPEDTVTTINNIVASDFLFRLV